MKTEHLSEESIQQLALEPGSADGAAKQHLQTCSVCAESIAEYKLLFSAIEQTPAPEFNFDLARLVMEKLDEAKSPHSISVIQDINVAKNTLAPAKNQKNSWLMIAAAFITFIVVGVPFYYFKNDIQNLVSGFSVMAIYLIVISLILIAGFQIADEYRKYNQKINSLDF